MTPSLIHDLFHRIMGFDYPQNHWWIDLLAVLAFVVTPAWTGWLIVRLGLRWAGLRRRLARPGAVPPRGPQPMSPAAAGASGVVPGWRLEHFIVRATLRFQLRLVLLSLLTLPAAWLLLGIPKHIINRAITDADGDGYPELTILGLTLSQVELLFALCAGYLAVLTIGGLAKYAVNRARGRVNERLVRRLRLAIIRRTRGERSPERRAALAAVAVQEVEPIGYFGASLVAVPLVQGGSLVTSVVFLLLQNAALALAALMMLPVQLTVLPRLQRRLNAKVRERVYATRALGGLLTAEDTAHAPARAASVPDPAREAGLLRRMRLAEELERVRVEINDLKGRLKGVYNYTSNLTPFFFFAIGGYLVVQGRLSLGALVAALAAYKEIAPALRELFDFAQNWSDASARFEEVTKALGRSRPDPGPRRTQAPERSIRTA
ncbi:multidrug ABC transporter ATPase [Methylobacterium sp. 092160098-2]|uniref:multidrug ABC transporter ATPase n=1 Tax=Methylobacterium sp. 092160098-2 TaxID=3025129 RepID=UPI002381CE87|nr:multidrug ABC transporter ATPase [Methylobacterium sp. 092160098-2]MDE4916087.1 multidrug ABC transporter ATPase [Methylobacterium sp. 092160098-2]